MNPFRRRAAPPAPDAPTKDQIIAYLERQLAAQRDHEVTLTRAIAYQHQRMREQAAQILGSQTTVARFVAATEWLLLDRGVALPALSDVDATVALERVVANAPR